MGIIDAVEINVIAEWLEELMGLVHCYACFDGREEIEKAGLLRGRAMVHYKRREMFCA
jgi:hypothetical protein